MGARVAVAGASGYAGGELLRLLASHPDLELGAVTAETNAGQPIGAIHPHLAAVPALAGRRFDATDPQLIADCDLAFLALPHGQSGPLAAQLPADTAIVDLGADFRLADPAAWQQYYRSPHQGRWTYGLPELPGARAAISAASRVAAPGCYATASILGLAPLLAAGLADPTGVVIVAASGTSGAGRSLKLELLASERMGSAAAYQAGGLHRHTPEIEQGISEAMAATPGGPGAPGQAGSPQVRISFTPLYAPMPRGILATCSAPLAGWPGTAWPDAEAGGPAAADATARLRDALTAAYAADPFVCVLPGGQWPATASVGGSNAAHLQVAADLHAGRAVVVTAIDNLGKGAAGQAIQNANLMLGLPETAGLTSYGVAP